MPDLFMSHDYVKPVFGGSHAPPSSQYLLDAREIFGTAFSIGGGVFLTAAHVIKAASSCELMGLGNPEEEVWQAYLFSEIELFEGSDVAVFRCPRTPTKAFAWHTSPLSMLTDVCTGVYAYGLDRSGQTVDVRTFAGKIVSARTYREFKDQPSIFELPFMCPRGISGSPLFFPPPSPKVCGMVFGNSITDMIVYSEKETSVDGLETTILQRVEAMHLGTLQFKPGRSVAYNLPFSARQLAKSTSKSTDFLNDEIARNFKRGEIIGPLVHR